MRWQVAVERVDGPHPVVAVHDGPSVDAAVLWVVVSKNDMPGVPFWFGTWQAATIHARDILGLLRTQPAPTEPVPCREDSRSALRLSPLGHGLPQRSHIVGS